MNKKALVLVESPAKAHTINKILGKKYIVKASMGHLIDLPKSRLGVIITEKFEPEYIRVRGKGPILKELSSLAKKNEVIYLAADPDREGEAIAWHLYNYLKAYNNNIHRIEFNEITPAAIKKAIKEPREVQMNLVNAQQARRILDRIVGYRLSPLLWRKVTAGLSAGRVQSIALRLVCDREDEINAFETEEYWSITADLHKENDSKNIFSAKLIEFAGKKCELKNESETNKILKNLTGKKFIIKKIKKQRKEKKPLPPYITSTLQQDASRNFRYSAQRTMRIAQELYEGVRLGSEGPVGLITYMRTDSTRLSGEAVEHARELITNRFGEEYLPEKIRIYKSKKTSQDAHEAIRITRFDRTPDTLKGHLSNDQLKIYTMIFNRFIASQMKNAVFDLTTCEIEAGEGMFRANGMTLVFRGFLTVQEDKKSGRDKEESSSVKKLPVLQETDPLVLHELNPKQHFTKPPPRYNDASLIQKLEEEGIGRPSTYAPTLQVIQRRNYAKKENMSFRPTELGTIVNKLLIEHFKHIVDIHFTARMESELDKIENGELDWQVVLKDFYEPFMKEMEKAEKNMANVKEDIEEEVEVECPKCGSPMKQKFGRFGKFLACTKYPECKTTMGFKINNSTGKIEGDEPKPTGKKCPECQSDMVIKNGRFGQFMACARYPECKTTQSISMGISCPEKDCDGEMAKRRTKKGRQFFSCSNYPKCEFSTWYEPVDKKCPECGYPFLVKKSKKNSLQTLTCVNEECEHSETVEETGNKDENQQSNNQ